MVKAKNIVEQVGVVREFSRQKFVSSQKFSGSTYGKLAVVIDYNSHYSFTGNKWRNQYVVITMVYYIAVVVVRGWC